MPSCDGDMRKSGCTCAYVVTCSVDVALHRPEELDKWAADTTH